MARAATTSDAFNAVAEPRRREILSYLVLKERPVGNIVATLKLDQPSVSKHLRVLRLAKLVTEERIGRERVYELRPAPLQQVAGWLEGYRAIWQSNLDRLKHYLETER